MNVFSFDFLKSFPSFDVSLDDSRRNARQRR
jgi:hypothetical protein